MGFSVWNARNVALSWVETVEYLAELGIAPVGEISELSGVFTTATPAAIQRFVARMDTSKNEGVVLRLSGEIAYDDFGVSVAKWVRKEHVSTSRHWMHAEVVRNELAQMRPPL